MDGAVEFFVGVSRAKNEKKLVFHISEDGSDIYALTASFTLDW